MIVLCEDGWLVAKLLETSARHMFGPDTGLMQCRVLAWPPAAAFSAASSATAAAQVADADSQGLSWEFAGGPGRAALTSPDPGASAFPLLFPSTVEKPGSHVMWMNNNNINCHCY